jgi:AAA15 family ATPase/GTPase
LRNRPVDATKVFSVEIITAPYRSDIHETVHLRAAAVILLAEYDLLLRQIVKQRRRLTRHPELGVIKHKASKVLSDAAGKVFSNTLIDRTDPGDQAVIQYLAQNPTAVEALNKDLQRIDVGVEKMNIVQTATGPAAQFKHQGLHVDMPWMLESHGTRSFIRIFPLILSAFQNGGIAIVDELDLSIHALILPEILRWFYDPGRNPSPAYLGAELINQSRTQPALDDGRTLRIDADSQHAGSCRQPQVESVARAVL